MNLPRVRLLLTIVYAVISTLAVGIMATVAIRTGTKRLDDQVQRSVEQKVADYQAEERLDSENASEDDTWFVTVGEGRGVQPLGEEFTNPPFFKLAQSALDNEGPIFENFSDQGGHYLAFARPLSENGAIVAAVSRDEALSDIRSLKLRMILASLGVILGTTAAGWWLAGRSLRPARSAVDRQRNFIADAAHELRTPLAVIQASASHTLSRPRDTSQYVESLSEILEASERAGDSVRGLLDFARLANGQSEPRLSTTRLDLMVEELAATTRAENISVEAKPGAPVTVEADIVLLRQALDNLVRNSMKRANKVTLSTAVDGREALVRVADNGPGFDPEVLPHVFERFRRGDERGSSGLGMAIVQSIVVSHRGRCEASNDPNGGAVVSIRLPLSKHGNGTT